MTAFSAYTSSPAYSNAAVACTMKTGHPEDMCTGLKCGEDAIFAKFPDCAPMMKASMDKMAHDQGCASMRIVAVEEPEAYASGIRKGADMITMAAMSTIRRAPTLGAVAGSCDVTAFSAYTSSPAYSNAAVACTMKTGHPEDMCTGLKCGEDAIFAKFPDCAPMMKASMDKMAHDQGCASMRIAAVEGQEAYASGVRKGADMIAMVAMSTIRSAPMQQTTRLGVVAIGGGALGALGTLAVMALRRRPGQPTGALLV